MAHADYDCCAICDCKMHYNGGCADAKAALCTDCIERTAELGKLCTRPEQVLEHLKSMNDVAALAWLHALGFSPCYYQNEFDDYLIGRKLVVTDAKEGGKWGKKLAPLPAIATE